MNIFGKGEPMSAVDAIHALAISLHPDDLSELHQRISLHLNEQNMMGSQAAGQVGGTPGN